MCRLYFALKASEEPKEAELLLSVSFKLLGMPLLSASAVVVTAVIACLRNAKLVLLGWQQISHSTLNKDFYMSTFLCVPPQHSFQLYSLETGSQSKPSEEP